MKNMFQDQMLEVKKSYLAAASYWKSMLGPKVSWIAQFPPSQYLFSFSLIM